MTLSWYYVDNATRKTSHKLSVNDDCSKQMIQNIINDTQNEKFVLLNLVQEFIKLVACCF